MKKLLTRVALLALAACASSTRLWAAQPEKVSVELLDAGAGEANDALAQELQRAGFVIGKRARAKAVRTQSEIFYAKGFEAQARRAGKIAKVGSAYIKPLTWESASPIVMAMAHPDGVLVVETGKENVVRVVGKKGSSDEVRKAPPPLVAAAKQGDEARVRALLRRGVDVNATDRHGNTALFAAVGEGRTSVVALLLDKGADPAIANNQGSTPLTRASNNGETEIARLLLEAGARPREIDLYWAAHNGHVDLVEILLEREVDPCAHGEKYGDTPLMRAANNSHLEVVKLLAATKTCDIHATNHDGMDALMMAARNGNKEEVEILLKLGADPTRRAEDGRNALQMARGNNQRGVYSILQGAMKKRAKNKQR